VHTGATFRRKKDDARGKRAPRITFAEVVRVVDLNVIPAITGTGDDFRFWIEVLRRGGRALLFTVRVWRIEFYRLQATFPQSKGRPSSQRADEQVVVVDDNFVQGLSGRSAESLLRKVIREIESRFSGLK